MCLSSPLAFSQILVLENIIERSSLNGQLLSNDMRVPSVWTQELSQQCVIAERERIAACIYDEVIGAVLKILSRLDLSTTRKSGETSVSSSVDSFLILQFPLKQHVLFFPFTVEVSINFQIFFLVDSGFFVFQFSCSSWKYCNEFVWS